MRPARAFRAGSYFRCTIYLEFYNSNANRAYPFLVGTVNKYGAASNTVERLANSVIVDAGFVMGLESGFISGTHSVWLNSIVSSGGTVTFNFASDAPGLYHQQLSFAFSTSAAQFTTCFTDNNDEAYGESEGPNDALYSSGPCENEPLWYGFVTIGKLTAVSAGTTTRSTGGIIEPALVQNLAGTYVSSLNLANTDRTRVTAPLGCDPISWPYPIGEVYISARCLRGDIRFTLGYNATVRQDTLSNEIIFGASPGAGDGAACSEVALFDGEVPPKGSDLLEGGPLCNQVISSINGVGGQYSSLLGGTGVRLDQDPTHHAIIVNVDLNQLTVCFGSGFSDMSESI